MKPHIFLVTGKSPTSSLGGGYGTYANALCSILRRLEYKVTIISLDKQTTTALPFLPWYSLQFAWRILSDMKTHQYSSIIVWGIGPWGLAGAIVKLLSRKKIRFVVNYFTTISHETRVIAQTNVFYRFFSFIGLPFFTFCEKITLQSADRIVTNYDSTEKILKTQFPTFSLSKKIFRSHFWIDISTSKTKNIPKLPKDYILFLSRLDARKGLPILLEAMQILLKRNIDIPLLVAGTGPMEREYKQLTKRLGLTSHVHFLGFVQNKQELFKRAKLFCLPTLEEGAGSIAINEAMSYGVPIIASHVDGISEDITNGIEGILVKPNNPKLLVTAIQKVLTNKKFREKLGRQAAKKYKKLSDYQKTKHDIQQLLFRLFE